MLRIRFARPAAGNCPAWRCLLLALGVALASAAVGRAEEPPQTPGDNTPEKEKAPAEQPAAGAEQPCITGQPRGVPSIDAGKIPRFGANSPFDSNYKPPVEKKQKRMWADSWRWTPAPELVVEKWLGDKPDTEGKYVLIEFWATWCGPCRRSIPLLNGFHEKFGDELVVIGISDETEQDVRKMTDPKIEFFLAVDTKARVKNKLGVWGIPHVILLEPGGCVIWEGFPLQEDFALTEEIIEKILAVGRKLRAGTAVQKK